jgi:hypothetical protein
MKKICLTVVGLYFWLLSAFSQSYNVDTSSYKNQKLRLDEVNLVSGYFNQDGNHSAVTGGIGTQKLSDVSNVIELQFVKQNALNNKYTWNIEMGFDHHTAASQAYINTSGASRPYGNRFYPSVNWKVEKANGLNFGFGTSISSEVNYHSLGLNFSLGKSSKNKNTSIDFQGQAFFDKVVLIEPSEFVPKPIENTPTTYTTASGNVISTEDGEHNRIHIPRTPRNTYSGTLTFSQVINKNFQLALIAEGVAQNGYLGLPFHRVYFTDGSEKIENLPSTRLKLPLAIRLNYFLGDKVILRSYYRYYKDDWGIQAQTASLEVPYKISPFVSISPFYRYYIQTASRYFAPYGQHQASDPNYTSNYNLSAFTSQFYGVNVRITPEKGVFHVPFFNMVELRYGHYTQTTGLQANNIGINLRFK